ncbi:MAG: hypothetical protein Q8M07_19590, partial [Prosthecobacter sp.]|nr:hypothetical protein [Prosthecobacter sp.]
MKSAHVTSPGLWQQRAILLMLSVVWIALGTAAENPSLEKVLTGIDWKKLAKTIPDDAEFQTSVRGVFGSLTPEGQRKVANAMDGLRKGLGPTLTGTPVDTLVAKKLVKALGPLVFDPDSKNTLLALEASGSLPELMDSLTGAETAAKPSTVVRVGKASQAFDVSWIEGKTWVSDAGTKWAFGKEGAGEKTFGKNTSTFSWRVLRSGSGLVEVSGRDTP